MFTCKTCHSFTFLPQVELDLKDTEVATVLFSDPKNYDWILLQIYLIICTYSYIFIHLLGAHSNRVGNTVSMILKTIDIGRLQSFLYTSIPIPFPENLWILLNGTECAIICLCDLENYESDNNARIFYIVLKVTFFHTMWTYPIGSLRIVSHTCSKFGWNIFRSPQTYPFSIIAFQVLSHAIFSGSNPPPTQFFLQSSCCWQPCSNFSCQVVGSIPS